MSGTAKYRRSIVWLRRDLRLDDNVALYEACRQSDSVCLAFVVNPPLLQEDRMGTPLVTVFFDALAHLRDDLRREGSDLAILSGDFADELRALAKRIDADAVFYNEDYEPSAITRDESVTRALADNGIDVHGYLDHVYFGADEIVRDDGAPYSVFSPYKQRWLERRAALPRPPVESKAALGGRMMPKRAIGKTNDVPEPSEFGYTKFGAAPLVSEAAALQRLDDFLSERVDAYREERNIPAHYGTSHLSVHLRAGTVGIRTCVEAAVASRRGARPSAIASIDTWISELIWRDFYQMILKRHPRVVGSPFRTETAAIEWEGRGDAFDAWCNGRTGYPLVDAGMRQLNEFGWMHNRLRMVTASFLTKHLLVDWRLGERYFETHLIDADVAQNNGGWQWAASTGTDAAPYFRIFSPVRQSRAVDPDGTFIRRFVPELANVPDNFIHEPWTMPPLLQGSLNIIIGRDYPEPLVDHAYARERAIALFKNAAFQKHVLQRA